ncbi:uncharacterized protein LOC142986543 [Anticarsia gemmatalis]|uniref:uncharacterized protein LOC142986543 n=1 Tax=Anticarsia gemmatalis TaxID=129554 RepID=UPI003F76B6E3
METQRCKTPEQIEGRETPETETPALPEERQNHLQGDKNYSLPGDADELIIYMSPNISQTWQVKQLCDEILVQGSNPECTRPSIEFLREFKSKVYQQEYDMSAKPCPPVVSGTLTRTLILYKNPCLSNYFKYIKRCLQNLKLTHKEDKTFSGLLDEAEKLDEDEVNSEKNRLVKEFFDYLDTNAKYNEISKTIKRPCSTYNSCD